MIEGETTVNAGHRHLYRVTEAGNGKTGPGPADGHTHDIELFEVLPAVTDGHTHDLLIDIDEDE